MAAKTPISLLNFFIYNPEYGAKEGEEEKQIMFYYPKDIDIDTKIRHIGLCEAIVKFSETFSDKPCESVHTQKTRQLFFEAEQDFWMIMTLNIPSHEKVKDGQTYIEYHEDDVQDSVYASVLRQTYKMFKLFNGSFECILRKTNIQGLQQRMEHFFTRFLLTVKLSQCDILDVFNGIQFLPLDKNTFLRMQCFINLLESTFPAVKYTAFLYNDQLVWSGLEQEDMRIMYQYLTTSLFPNHLEQELQAGHSSNKHTPAHTHSHYGKFITGPRDLKDTANNMGKIPHVFINTQEPNEECYLLVYKGLSASVCMLINVTSNLTFEICQNLDGFLGPQLTALASDISEQYSRKPAPSLAEPQYRYIYFNHMNLAQKTTVHVDARRSSNLTVPTDTLKLVSGINSHLKMNGEDGETIVKTLTDCWVVGKKSDQREFYVIINQKNANLIEINEEVKRLCATHFNSIFFLD